MEDIDRERIVVFIGISLLLSLTVNWQLNVYAHNFNWRLIAFSAAFIVFVWTGKTVEWTQ